MKSKVWFAPINDREEPANYAGKCLELLDKAGMSELVKKDSFVGILQHVGEGSNTGYVKPEITGAVAGKIKELGGKAFLTGSSTLYSGRRHNAVDHMLQAYDHGFVPQTIGCPIIMSDGLRGADRMTVTLPSARHCKTAYLGNILSLTDALVVITHPTGHIASGFAAAIKNVAMGLSSRGGKLAMHHGSHPDFLSDKCTACGRCAEWCPENAIEIQEKAVLDKTKCIGCGQCFAVCGFGAISFQWTMSGDVFQQRLVEYALAVKHHMDERMIFLNVIQHFQEGCDCFDIPQEAICGDVGIVVSRDPLAVDVATADLLKEKIGHDVVKAAGKHEYLPMFEYAEKIGVGSRNYELIT